MKIHIEVTEIFGNSDRTNGALIAKSYEASKSLHSGQQGGDSGTTRKIAVLTSAS
jgi:hypothetical protein